MTLPTTSSNDDKNLLREAQLNLQLLNEILPEVVPEVLSEATPSQSADTGRKRALDQSGSSTYKPVDPNDMADMRARMEAIYAKRRKAAPQLDEVVEMVVHEGSRVKIDTTRPPSPKEGQLDWTNFQNPRHAPKVALKVGDSLVIGGAGFDTLGYALNLLLDGGANGQPSVSFIIRFNKKNQGQALSTDKKDLHRFVAQYKFNSIVNSDDQGNDLYMVKSFSHEPFNRSQLPEVQNDVWRQGMVATESCKPSNYHKLIAVKLIVQGVCVTEGGTSEDLAELVQRHPNEPFAAAVTDLLRGPFPLILACWFEWKKHWTANEQCLRYLQHALELRVPPLAQFCCEDNRLARAMAEGEIISERVSEQEGFREGKLHLGSAHEDPRIQGKQHVSRQQSESSGKVKGYQRLKDNSQNRGNLDQIQGHRKEIDTLRRKLRRVEEDKQQEVEQLNMELRWAKFEKQRAEYDLRAVRR